MNDLMLYFILYLIWVTLLLQISLWYCLNTVYDDLLSSLNSFKNFKPSKKKGKNENKKLFKKFKKLIKKVKKENKKENSFSILDTFLLNLLYVIHTTTSNFYYRSINLVAFIGRLVQKAFFTFYLHVRVKFFLRRKKIKIKSKEETDSIEKVFNFFFQFFLYIINYYFLVKSLRSMFFIYAYKILF